MSSSNCVADVRKLLVRAIKSGDGTVQEPSKWARAAGYQGSAASPLREHMARVSGNGCGRSRRYPPMSAEELTELLDLADRYRAEQDQRKAEALGKRIGTKLRPAQSKGARTAKTQGKGSPRKAAKAPKEEAAAAE